MTENVSQGIILILIAGFFQGTFMVPMKYTRDWKWENTWLGFTLTAYLVCPWLLALATVPHLGQVIGQISGATLARTLLWGLGWGLGALTFGLGASYLGVALGFAVIIGLTAAIGTVVPLLVLSHVDPTSARGLTILTGMAIVLVGIVVCSWAGKMREKSSAGTLAMAPEKRSYALGLVLCIASGILCPCGNLGFAFGAQISAMATRLGTPSQYASYPIWAILTLPLLICNTVYCVYLLITKRSLANFSRPGAGRYALLAASMGAMWLAGMILYGMGANRLGNIGSSIGWALVMSLMVLTANVWGLTTGEWRGATPKTMRVMSAGLTILVLAMFLIGAGIRP